jgi:hydrogenase assembly chaperone HypC/HupF
MIKQGINSPQASSCGRLFDAVAAAIGICPDEISHEGEAAMRLEALVDAKTMASVHEDLAYPFGVPKLKGSGLPYIEPLAMWQALLGDLYEKTPAPVIAARFHKGLAKVIVKLGCEAVLDGETRLTQRIVLSGGVMHNRRLAEELVRRFEAENFEVFLQAKVPSNDGGLSLGQAAVAAAMLVRGGLIMCLGIPGRIVSISNAERKLATVDVSGVKREVNIACIIGERTIDACIGDWVLVHVGFAMSVIDEQQAAETLQILIELGEAQDEIRAMRTSGQA